LRAKKLKNVEKIFLFWFRRSELPRKPLTISLNVQFGGGDRIRTCADREAQRPEASLAIFSDGDETLNWVVGEVMLLIFQELLLLVVDTYRTNLFYHPTDRYIHIYSN